MNRVPAQITDFWVFGYGSLMWRPGFPYVEDRTAVVHGYHRALCIYSHIYRGTLDCPGLVLGLDRGGSCKGRAFRVAAADRAAIMDYLHEREMPNDVYMPRWLKAKTAAGPIECYGFVANHRSTQYTGRLSVPELVPYLVQGCGKGGTAMDYLVNTIEHLDDLGIADGPLHAALKAARNYPHLKYPQDVQESQPS